MSNHTLNVEKLGKPIILMFDGSSLSIEGDSTTTLNNKKKGTIVLPHEYYITALHLSRFHYLPQSHYLTTPGRSCICVPTSAGPATASKPGVVSVISNRNVLYAFYNPRTNMIQLNALIPDHVNDPESTLTLNKYMYTVKNNEKEKAIQFCQLVMKSIYQGW